MKQTDHHQHSDGMLQEFYAMTQKPNELIGKSLGSTPGEQERLVDDLLWSMNPKLWARVAHLMDGKEVEQRPTYYKLVKFAVQKEVEINFDDAKMNRDSTSKPKATSHFCYSSKKSNLLAPPAVQMVVPAPEEDPGDEAPTLLPSEESDSGESYEAMQEEPTISQGDIEIAVRVAHTAEAFTGHCFRCNEVGHRF